MDLRQKLESLLEVKSTPSVTISLNTHRNHPENQQDEIVLKNLLKEAESRVEEEYGKKEASVILEKLGSIAEKIDHNHNLESMHIFISNDTEEIIKTTHPTDNIVIVDDRFSVKSLIKAVNRSVDYLIMTLAQGGTRLYRAINDSIIEEVEAEGFPFPETPFVASKEEKSDSKRVDNLVKEYFNHIDKALVAITKGTELKTVVISTEDNYSKLLEVADRPEIYAGHDNKEYNKADRHHLAQQAYEIIKGERTKKIEEVLAEIGEATNSGNVLTDLQEIYQASIDGRAELLVVNQEYEQAVRMVDDRTFEYVEDAKEKGIVDDIVSNIALEVISKKGKVYFIDKEISGLGKIALPLSPWPWPCSASLLPSPWPHPWPCPGPPLSPP